MAVYVDPITHLLTEYSSPGKLITKRNNSVYLDLNTQFKSHPGTKDVLKKIDAEAVKSAIRNIIIGNPFEVPFDPNFGCQIEGLLFEQQSPTLNAITKRNIQLKLAEYEPRCTVEDITITSHENDLDIEIKYYVTGIIEVQTLNFTLQRRR